jgi:hypothetical protein
MTPQQYCFPYVFNEYEFRDAIRLFGLDYEIGFDEKLRMVTSLKLCGKGGFELVIGSFFCLMFNTNGDLLIWKSNEDEIDITRIFFANGEIDKRAFKISLNNYKIGENKAQMDYGLSDFVTYVRKSDLKYDLNYYENFCIVIVRAETIDVIPFDSFNKTGGDYGYIWPATARLDFEHNEIKGKGMRMADFTIQL